MSEGHHIKLYNFHNYTLRSYYSTTIRDTRGANDLRTLFLVSRELEANNKGI